MSQAVIKSTGQQVSIISVSGGWTTIIDEMGTESKVRNGALEQWVETVHNNLVAESNFEVTRDEFDDPDHNDVKEEFIDDKPAKNRIRHVKDATYNPEHMRKLTSVAGNLSYDCGDHLARRLEGKTLEQVYDIASKELGISKADLMKRYEHLNVGMQRMNLGNRIRAKASKAAKAHIEHLEAEQHGSKNRNS